MMKNRWALIQRGLFPETLPPCFTSVDLKRAFSGLIKPLNKKALHKDRHTDYVRYNGTKHDSNRRYFGTPNPISYFYVASFIAEHWKIFESRFNSSPFSVSQPRLGKDTDDRPVIIPSLSELTTIASKKLAHSAYILKTDIAQFFPSIYTHSIPWSAHGIEDAKADQAIDSSKIYFNKLDFFTRNCQRAETRGVLVGPDAFRLIAEFVAAGLDVDINSNINQFLIGAARHVDDYYFGLRNQPAAMAALSKVRDALLRYNLQINDAKTQTMEGIEPLNEIWAQELRREARDVKGFRNETEDLILFYDRALTQAKQIRSDSPVKIALRTLDQIRVYGSDQWDTMEPYLQRTLFHHPHCVDYVCLIVAKRFALSKSIDKAGWKGVAYELIERHLSLNHHHEIVWLLWLLLVTKIEITIGLVASLSANTNAHVRSLVVAAFTEKLIPHPPAIKLGGKLATTDDNWLLNLVAKAGGYSRAPFSGSLSMEFSHLAEKKVRLIDFKAHMKAMKKATAQAISRTRYGYDGEDEEEDLENDDPRYHDLEIDPFDVE